MLDVLAGRKDPKKVDGTILLDGKAVDRKVLKDMSGYVQQEDLVMGKNGLEKKINKLFLYLRLESQPLRFISFLLYRHAYCP